MAVVTSTAEAIQAVANAISKLADLMFHPNLQKARFELKKIKDRIKANEYAEEYIHETKKLLGLFGKESYVIADVKKAAKIIDEMTKLERKFFKHD